MNKNQHVYLGLLALLLAANSANGQSPGGVPAAAWYRADAPATLFSDGGSTAAVNNSLLQQWNESQSTGRNLVQATAGSKPVYSTSVLANFNPTVTFDGSNDWMQFTASTGVNLIDRANGSIYTSGYVNTLKRCGFVGFNATMDYPGLHVFSNNKVLLFTGGPGYQGLSTPMLAGSTYFSTGGSWQNSAGTSTSYAAATVSVNGTRTDYSASQLQNVVINTASRDFRIGADNNYGSFSGQLNEVLVFEDKLSTAQMDQVESYLAIKYGTTYAAGLKDYKNAAGGTIWSASTNAGWGNNIAGIANDGSLNQKQSWSTNTTKEVLISTVGLANTNATNGTGLTAGQYLMWGDNGLAKAPTVPFTSVAGVSHRFASVWKVQNTSTVGTVRIAWPKGFTNLTLIRSSDATFATGNVSSAMTLETTVNGVIYNYVDVTLTNGQYFTFAAKMSAPGGVTSDIRIWLKSDNGFTPSQWNDQSGNSNNYTQTNANRQPFTAIASYNFNPAIDFGSNVSADGRFMVVPSGQPYSENGTSSSIFTVNLDRSVGGYADILGFGATTTAANLIQANLPVFTRLGADINIYPYANASPSLPAMIANKLYLSDVSFTVGTAGIKYGQNGTLGSNNQTFNAAAYAKHANGSVLGSQGEVRNGLIGEVIAYERDLTEAEKQRVRTYTALKYGITLPHNYIASDGTTILWNQTTNTGYNNNIAGIATDDGSALIQKQSNSINASQQVLIGTSGIANSNALNTVAVNNGQALIWGDNGMAKTLSKSYDGGATLNSRFASIWKVQNTNTVGTVRVAWPAGITNLTLIQSPDATIDEADTKTNMTTNSQTVNGVVYNYADVTLGNGSYFTFGGSVTGPGGVGLNLSLWYKADNGVETNASQKVTGWNNSAGKDIKLSASGADYIPYNDQTTFTKTWNFNPTLSFDGTNNYLKNTDSAYLTPGGSVHYISVVRLNAASTGYNSLFAISGNDDGFFLNNSAGNISGMPTIGNSFNVAAAGSDTTTRFGIYSAILPKTGTPANQRGFLNGLEKIYTTPYPVTGATYSLPASGKGAYLGADGTTGDNPNGDIAEVVLYHETTGGDMTNADLGRIHSYLAIKYGITLDQTIAQNYVNSTYGVVWEAAINGGNKFNIAGIARDNEGSLYQKQSWSVNNGSQVLISTTGLENTNATNTVALTNGQFLIWGDNNLAKAPKVAITGIAGVNYRFASIWKAQNTNSVGTVRVAWVKGYTNLKLIQSTDSVFTSSDVVTDMTGTTTVNNVEYAYADVTIANGQFFTFAAFVQAPGGVTNNLSYWYRADKFAEATGEGTDVTSWTDFTSGTVSSEIGDVELPKYKNGTSTYFNFNPGVNFTAVAQKIGNMKVQTLNSVDFDIFTLTKEGMTGTRFFNIGMDNTTTGGSNWDQPAFYPNGTIARRSNTGALNYFASPSPSYTNTISSITYNTFSNTSLSRGLNGAANGATATHPAIGSVTGGHIFGANSGAGSLGDDAGFVGSIGEVVIYGNGTITAPERNKVESYLAIKYGVTLDTSNNYTTSQDAVIWNKVTNKGHYNNVAGIGNDFVSALHQKQSRSQYTNNPNDQVTIGLGDIFETNFANTNSLSNNEFLVWGDNGKTQTLTAASMPLAYSGTSSSQRIRVWKVQNTNATEDVKISFPQASVGTKTLTANDACAQYAIIYADDSLFTQNVVAVPVTLNGTDYETMHSFPNGMSYFTYGRVTPITSGIVYLPSVIETTNQVLANCGISSSWAYFNNTADPTLKLLATSNVVTTPLTVTITPEGTSYDDGTKKTNLMARISTVVDGTAGTYTGVKVRVYYSQAELSATQLHEAITNGWFKYEGVADDVLADIYSDGVFEAGKAVALTPNATGVEDGVSYVEFHNLTSFSSFVYISSTETEQAVLPLTFIGFDAQKVANGVNLVWNTVTEFQNKGFEVQRSADARNWISLGFVNSLADNGNSNAKLDYQFLDTKPLVGMNYYRLKSVSLSGEVDYSWVKSVRYISTNKIEVMPNPTKGNLQIKGLSTENNKISVMNSKGQLLGTFNTNGSSSYVIDMSSYVTGFYIIKVIDENGIESSFKVVKE